MEFKTGDKVVFIGRPGRPINTISFIIGHSYTIGGYFHNNIDYSNIIGIKKDEQNIENGWSHEYFIHDLPLLRIIYGV